MIIFKKSNIPNFLSVFRILLVPFFVYLFVIAGLHTEAIAVFLLAGLTDVIDGLLARRYKWISNVGKVLDPFADKCMQIAALVCLWISGLVEWWISAVLVIKEVALLFGGLFALGKEKVYVQSDWYGKAGTVAFYIIATMLVLVEEMSDTLRLVLGILLIFFMLFAFAMYVSNFANIVKKTNTKG